MPDQTLAQIDARSARALGIEDWEREALIALLPRLKANELPIDMASLGGAVTLGCCVGAIVATCHPDGLSAFSYVCLRRSPALAPLYSPGWGKPNPLAHPGWGGRARDAAIAVKRFLAGAGAACWDGVIGGPA